MAHAPDAGRWEGERVKRWAIGAAVATFGAYMIGAGRAFGYDSAVTMHNFVDGPPSWALTRQIVWNNHPLFSLIESLIADVAGTGEVVMRVAPVGFTAAAVGVLVWRLGQRWGVVSGLCAGLVVACHPMLVPLARDVRGYSLATLAIVLMGVAVLDRPRPWLFAVAAAAGVGAHMYAVIPAVALVAWLAAGGMLRDPRWRTALIAGGIGGLLLQAGTLPGAGRAEEARVFDPMFPVDAGWEVLGGSAVAVGALGVVLIVAARHVTWDRRAAAMGLVLACGVLGPWVMAPTDLYPRFVYWAVPGIAAAVAFAVHRAPPLAGVAALAMVTAVAPLVPNWTDDAVPNRALAAAAPADACAAGWSYEAVRWYAELETGSSCETVAFLVPELPDPAIDAARERWPVLCWASDDGAEVRARRTCHTG